MSALDLVRDEIVGKARAQGYELTPWFETNQSRLRVFSDGLQRILGRLPVINGDSDRTRAEIAHTQLRSAIERLRPPEEVAWFERNRALLISIGAAISGQQREQAAIDFTGRVRPLSASAPPPESYELRSEAERTLANVEAIQILTSKQTLDDTDRAKLRRYTGWGGLSIKRAAGSLPPDWVPEKKALIHEYYTPEFVANAIAQALLPFQSELTNSEGLIRVLEPSAGIGRLIHAFRPEVWPQMRWTAIELSKVSASLLAAVRPDITVVNSPLEQWVLDNKHLSGTYDLVVSNPPYGVRGRYASIDREKGYGETRAYAYQIRRGIDMLRPNGVGVFLIPSGFMSGTGPSLRALRERVLLRAHLMGAFRLPSETEDGKSLFPGALLVTDLVFLRSRGGSIPTVPDADQFILDGRYFKVTPEHVLGREVGQEGDDDEQGRAPRWGYQVRGTFQGLPALEERDLCRDCAVTPQRRPEKKKRVELPEHAEHALALARRVAAYLALIARGDIESTARAASAYPELHHDLTAWFAQSPEQRREDLKYAKSAPELATLANVFAGGTLITELASPPKYEERYPGSVEDIPTLAHWLWRRSRSLSLDELVKKQHEMGGAVTPSDALTALHNAGWCEDPGGTSPLLPKDQYYSGNLWPKYDRARERAEAGDAVAAVQASQLLAAIKPATFAEINVEPRLGWLPLQVVEAWVNDVTRGRGNYALEREGPFLTLVGVKYLDVAHQSDLIRLTLGYLNHDMTYFRPSVSREENLEEKRTQYAAQFKEHFIQWIEKHPEHQAVIAEAHNRIFRGWVTPAYSPEPVAIARWNNEYPLWPYQNAAVRRLVENRGGGCFFDVGLGKTRTLLGAVALAKQQGLARRVVIAAPNSLVFNWAREIERVLPDFRYAIIGARAKVISRGPKKGELVSEPDTPEIRAAKWQRFQAGLYDIVIVTYSALPRTQLALPEILEVVRSVPAVQRELVLKVRETERRIESLEKKEKAGKLDDEQAEELRKLRLQLKGMAGTERKEAILEEREEGFAAKWAVPPVGQEPDPGIFWEKLGIDFLGYDESHIGKNLWTAGSREGGEPRFLGSPQEGSYIAWQLYLRAHLVRKSTGGTGIYLADATPAKNSPLEFLSILSLIDSDIWNRLGISDPEQYITQYLNIQTRLIQDTDLEPAEVPCVVGFKNLDQLREVLFRYGEFRTAKQVGLKIPEPRVHRIEVDMDDDQEAKYEAYLEAYQSAIENLRLNPEGKFAALGLLQRMALVAVHALLDEGPPEAQGTLLLESPSSDAPEKKRRKDKPKWTFANARLARKYDSPKLRKIVEIILKRRDCGHIIFLENVAAHYWLKQLLIEAGIPESRIAILNGETAPDPASRQRIAEGFTTAEPPLYDIVIANRIAYEGVNLQTRTCSIFHGDLPYEPATLQQRNGRGQRQGNRYDVIDIYYILSKRSSDMARFQLIAGKREWMAAILESAASETNNPAAQADLSPEDWLIYLSRDEAKTRALIETKKKQAQEAENQRLIKLAWAAVRQIAIRQRDAAAATDPIAKAHLLDEIGRISADVAQTDPLIWPWRFVAIEAAQHPTLSFAPAHDGAVWETACLVRSRPDGTQYGGGEFGAVSYHPNAIGFRRFRDLEWESLNVEEAHNIWSGTSPSDWQQMPMPIEAELQEEANLLLQTIQRNGVFSFKQLRLSLASERYKLNFWNKWGLELVRALLSAFDAERARIPAKGQQPAVATLELLGGEGVSIYPFTLEGYTAFLADCRAAENLKWSDIDSITDWWWGKRAPRNLLATQEQDIGEQDGQV
ncbi:MAG: SNF2-related protein [Polyangia bacterium]